ncbi:MAG: hypothetical protein EXS38_07040 [Opitutus sp.]|nr:hypothetical protein [Opitutus sp.]
MRKAINPQGTAAPSAPYSPAIVQNGFIFVSGQGPLDPKTGNYVPSDIQTETRQVFENIGSILAAAGSSFDKIVKVNVYLRDIGDFAAMNEVYARYFAAPFPARTTIQAGALPRGFAVEIECVAAQ